ncbi:MAG: hypothetical protein IJ111_01410 [Eggerthellaceae bacterium]|nr:hypothetical protein [Eggerthellaceae bacterium]
MSFGESNLRERLDELQRAYDILQKHFDKTCERWMARGVEIARQRKRIKELEHKVETRDESIRNLIGIMDKRQGRIKSLESLVRDMAEFIFLPGGCKGCPYYASTCKDAPGCVFKDETFKRMEELGIEVSDGD